MRNWWDPWLVDLIWGEKGGGRAVRVIVGFCGIGRLTTGVMRRMAWQVEEMTDGAVVCHG